MMRWNGVEIERAPIIRKTTPWQQINAALEDFAMWAILPCMMLGGIAGLPFA